MARLKNPVLQSVHDLFAGALTPQRFRKWRSSAAAQSAIMNSYAVGEIRWRPALGRPETATLSEGIAIEAWQEQVYQTSSPLGTVKTAIWDQPRNASWWDGASDDEYWRVAFLVGGLGPDLAVDPDYNHHTHIRPTLVRSVPWTHPGGKHGIATTGTKYIRGAHFVKGLDIVHLTFEVEILPWWTIDPHGVGHP